MNIALVRWFYCISVAASITVHAEDHLKYIRTRHLRKPTENGVAAKILGNISVPALGIGNCRLTSLLLRSCLIVGSGSGPFQPVSCAALLLAVPLYFLHFAQVLELDYVQEKASLMPFVLTILALSCNDLQGGRWFVLAIKVLLAHSYLAAALLKLRRTGVVWVSGQTLQGFLLMHHLCSDNKLALFIGRRPWLCRLGSVASLLFELCAPVAFFTHSLASICAVLGLAFHSSIAFTMGTDFMSYFFPVYAVFLPDILPTQLQCSVLAHLHLPTSSSCIPLGLSGSNITPIVESTDSVFAIVFSIALVAIVPLATVVYHVSSLYQRVPYWDIQALWPLFSWDLYSVPPHAECYQVIPDVDSTLSTDTQQVQEGPNHWDLDPVVVTACRIQIDTIPAPTPMNNVKQGMKSSQEEMQSHTQFLVPQWTYDLRSVAHAHLVLNVAPEQLTSVARFFGMLPSNDKNGQGRSASRLQLLDHVIGTALKLADPEVVRHVTGARLVRRTLDMRRGRLHIVDKVLRRCTKEIVSDASHDAHARSTSENMRTK